MLASEWSNGCPYRRVSAASRTATAVIGLYLDLQ
jgi:hypothetical protein